MLSHAGGVHIFGGKASTLPILLLLLIIPNNSFIYFVLFLKEIDAITAPSQPVEVTVPATAPPPTPPRPEPKESAANQVLVTANGTDQVAEWQYDTQCSLAGGELIAITWFLLQTQAGEGDSKGR